VLGIEAEEVVGVNMANERHFYFMCDTSQVKRTMEEKWRTLNRTFEQHKHTSLALGRSEQGNQSKGNEQFN
jgi:hypothetical protein